MASFRSSTTLAQGTRTNSTLTAPSGLADNDILVLVLYLEDDVAPTFPAGFSTPSNIDHSGVGFDSWAAWKRASGESGSYTVTHASAASQGYLVAVQNASTTANPSFGTGAQGSGTTATATSVTPIGDNAWIGFFVASFGTGAVTPPAGSTPTFTERYDPGDTLYAADGTLSPAGATGSKAVTISSNPWTAFMMVVEDVATNVFFPVVQTVAETATGVASATTSHVVTLPSGLAAGDLIVILCNKGLTSITFNSLAGYTELIDEAVANGMTVWARQRDGTEGGTVTFTSNVAGRGAFIAYRISGAELLATQAPQLSTVATGTSTAPNATTCTPTGGAKDYLWISFYGRALEELDDDTWSNTPPTDFLPSPPRQKACGTAGTNLGGILASAERSLNAASLDAGAFADDVSAAWRAFTLAVHPAAAGGGGVQSWTAPRRRQMTQARRRLAYR